MNRYGIIVTQDDGAAGLIPWYWLIPHVVYIVAIAIAIVAS